MPSQNWKLHLKKTGQGHCQDIINIFADKSGNPMLNLRTGHIASVELYSTSSFLKLLPENLLMLR